mgnify:FL=1
MGVAVIGRGTAKEIRLGIRALKAARTHLANSRCGLALAADDAVLLELHALEQSIRALAFVAGGGFGAPMRKGKKP